MSRATRLRATCFGLLLITIFVPGASEPQEPKKKPAIDEVEALINQLAEISEQDTGYSASTTGSAFLPLGKSEMHAGLLFQRPHTSSDAMKSLVKLGVKALPKLLEHLSDQRPTRITLKHGGFFVALHAVASNRDAHR